MLGANNISNLDLKTKNLETFLYNYYKEVSDICDEINTIWIIHMGRYLGKSCPPPLLGNWTSFFEFFKS